MSSGGRPETVVINPFVKFDNGDEINTLWSQDVMDIRVEDMIVGCVRSFNAATTKKQEYVNWMKVYKVYRNCNQITRKIVQTYLRCSESQAKRYIKVIKLTNQFMQKFVEGKSGSNVVGYPDIAMYARQYKLKDLTRFAE